jgi:hypothetical protein
VGRRINGVDAQASDQMVGGESAAQVQAEESQLDGHESHGSKRRQQLEDSGQVEDSVHAEQHSLDNSEARGPSPNDERTVEVVAPTVCSRKRCPTFLPTILGFI